MHYPIFLRSTLMYTYTFIHSLFLSMYTNILVWIIWHFSLAIVNYGALVIPLVLLSTAYLIERHTQTHTQTNAGILFSVFSQSIQLLCGNDKLQDFLLVVLHPSYFLSLPLSVDLAFLFFSHFPPVRCSFSFWGAR